jgi:flagellar hook-associated protein 1 FlgK
MVNEGMNVAARDQSTTLAYTTGLKEYFHRIEEIAGQPNGSSSLGTLLNNFQVALQKSASTPNLGPLRQDVINAGIQLTQKLRVISAELSKMRQDADQEIHQDLNIVNECLQEIVTLNSKIGSSNGQDQTTADLEDQRDLLLTKIAQYVEIQTYPAANNTLTIKFDSKPLLIGQTTYPLTYTPVSAVVTPDILYSSGLIQPITLIGKDVTPAFTTGRIGALIHMRDVEIPTNLQAQLDELAQGLRDEMNAVYNRGTAYPAPTVLTGNRSFSAGGATVFSGSGTLRIGITDSTGMFVDEFQLDLTTVNSLTTLMAAINTAASWDSGTVGATASLNANNQLVLTSATGPNGVGLTSLAGPARELTTGLEFSHYFGLNDFFTSGTRLAQDGNPLGRLGIANVIDVRSDIVANNKILAAGSLSTVNPLPLVPLNQNIGITGGNGTTLQAMNDALLATTQAFATAGDISAVTNSFFNYTSYILSHNAEKIGINIQNNDFNQQFYENLREKALEVSGVNRDEELSNLMMYEAAYQASARVISTLTAMLDAIERIKT